MKIKFLNNFLRSGRSILTSTRMIVLLLGLSQGISAQSPYTSIATGSWNNDNTWSGTGIPVAGDDVIIAGGHTVTLSADAACATLTVTGTLDIGNFIFTLSGDLAGTGLVNMSTGTFNEGDDIIGYAGGFNCGTGTVNF
jgi:hypothetical protein